MPAFAGEDPPESRARIKAVASTERPWVGQTVRLTATVAYDGRWFDVHGAPIFLQSVDVPIQVDWPAFRGLPDSVPLPVPKTASPPPSQQVRLAVNDRVVEATRRWSDLDVECAVRFERPGRIEIPAPSLKFVWASRFEEDLVRGRVPVDPRDVAVRGNALSLEVRPLPAQGRPADFSGAVGAYRLDSSASRASVRVGELFEVTLAVVGEGDEGNLDAIPTPRAVGLDGFHVFGATDEKAPGKRNVTFSVSPRDTSIREVPPISFSFFDPVLGAYRTEKTVPIPLEVLPGEAKSTPTAPAKPAVSEPTSPLRRWWPAALAAAMVLLASVIALRARRRASRRAAASPERLRLDRALAACREALERSDADLADGFTEVLAARLGCAPAAVISPDLAARLVAAGAEAGWSSRAAAVLDRLVAARYGGAPPDSGTISDVRDLTGTLRWTPPPRS